MRVPAHPVALALLRAAALPIAAPSANRFTELSPTTAQHVQKALGDRVDLILDGGAASVGIESTVVDLTGARPTLLRPGTVSAAAIAEVLGEMPQPAASPGRDDAPRPAPGMVERHYAPRATVWLFDASSRDAMAARLAREGVDARAGALLLSPWDARPAPALPLPMPDDPAAYARRLYAALHQLDDAGCAVVLVERPPDTPAWQGVRDRLARAAH